MNLRTTTVPVLQALLNSHMKDCAQHSLGNVRKLFERGNIPRCQHKEAAQIFSSRFPTFDRSEVVVCFRRACEVYRLGRNREAARQKKCEEEEPERWAEQVRKRRRDESQTMKVDGPAAIKTKSSSKRADNEWVKSS